MFCHIEDYHKLTQTQFLIPPRLSDVRVDKTIILSEHEVFKVVVMVSPKSWYQT
jgi:hypothetical protein